MSGLYMFLMLLGVLDVIAGLLLALSGTIPLTGNWFVIFFAIVMVLKGIWSVLAALGGGFKYDLLGLVDLVVGGVLWLVVSGWVNEAFLYLGIIVLIKGLWSFVMGYTSEA